MSTLFFAPAYTFLLQVAAASDHLAPAAQLLSLIVAVLCVAALRQIFVKAGQPSWAAFVPVYDLVVLLRVAGRPWWWVFPLLIPVANAIPFLFVCFDVARAFGRSRVFGVGLLALAPACQLILAYGDDRYTVIAHRSEGLALAQATEAATAERTTPS